MKIDREDYFKDKKELVSVKVFAERKGIYPNSINNSIRDDRDNFDWVDIDGITLIVMTRKSERYKPVRRTQKRVYRSPNKSNVIDIMKQIEDGKEDL